MKKIVKALSRQERVHGRVISGGSQIYENDEGQVLIDEIKYGFFEKKNGASAPSTGQLHLSYDAFAKLRKILLN
ncbi:hypothetical protein [Tunicatimonas pelagia]|uniref:hypothetical protein n=1 Tax=Tunicatimonas pelagia TaxID=931531 RepID=UPI00266709A3|nr:hypothetical protein [Tunicatimonas pelagia]WKN45169.1 hypothetical protein P0M28_09365 [Tunicatimonas pelagia]